MAGLAVELGAVRFSQTNPLCQLLAFRAGLRQALLTNHARQFEVFFIGSSNRIRTSNFQLTAMVRYPVPIPTFVQRVSLQVLLRVVSEPGSLRSQLPWLFERRSQRFLSARPTQLERLGLAERYLRPSSRIEVSGGQQLSNLECQPASSARQPVTRPSSARMASSLGPV